MADSLIDDDGAWEEPTSRAQDVAQQLRELIFDGELRAGSPIRQEAVARRLGVGRFPVREALRLLESEGLVVLRPNSGARVALLDFAECEEIYKMRERLEPLAFAESVGRLTPEQIERAHTLSAALPGLVHDPKRWLEGDRRLHLACYAGIPTPRLLRTIVSYWNISQQYRRVLLTTFTERDFELQHAEHELIIDALESDNSRAGEDLMRAHIERSRLRLTRHRHLFEE
ncbi:GntR family transcriptional regulator [Conexibacter woesei]|uniref:Transcriptional regulator, GntR family n=1 Tax=Conexibacter woesei (strain DSM 14684 / CCUG 47730 / CIP 108061 / JCM 11494 / NBRC 100937 / ID131577) TaxID=469383 RepID=D3FD92_CONWI|nr:GntR family transcriptional regulator [Conexibacter woesei]ADB53484.1 transcriptional regulator, GntR family [Conexibacter woesei DSM 14684]